MPNRHISHQVEQRLNELYERHLTVPDADVAQ